MGSKGKKSEVSGMVLRVVWDKVTEQVLSIQVRWEGFTGWWLLAWGGGRVTFKNRNLLSREERVR